jgi:hypothetical protein
MTAPAPLNSRQQHQRDTRLWIVLPMLLIGLLIAVGTGIVLALPGRAQISIIADWMVSILILCPSVICLFAVCVLLFAAVAGMNRLHSVAARPLYRAHDWSDRIAERAAEYGGKVSRRALGLGARFAFLSEWFRLFDPSQNQAPTDSASKKDDPK